MYQHNSTPTGIALTRSGNATGSPVTIAEPTGIDLHYQELRCISIFPVDDSVSNTWTPVDDSATNTWTEVDDRGS